MKYFIFLALFSASLAAGAEIKAEVKPGSILGSLNPFAKAAEPEVQASPAPAPEVPASPAPAPGAPAGPLLPLGPIILDHAIYQIMNKLDGGVLTIDSRNDSVPVFDRTYSSAAGQKWRLKKALIGASFLLIPTSNEDAVVDLDKNTLGIWGRIAALGSQRYWYLIGMGEGVIQIKNYHMSNLCLQSTGLDKETTTAACENSPAQQWIFKLL